MKALVLFSGGLDSSVCLGLAVKEYGPDEVLALSIYYGQKHRKELEASEKVAAFYGVKRITLVGSRTRSTARPDSDLDVLVEYEGSMKEYTVFNYCHTGNNA